MTRGLSCTASCLALCWCFGSIANAENTQQTASDMENTKVYRGPVSPIAVPRPETAADPEAGAPRGPGAFTAGFEAGEGFVVGAIEGQVGWNYSGDLLIGLVSTTNPATGTRHLELPDDPGNPDGTLEFAFSPDIVPTPPVGPSVVTLDCFVPTAPGANYRVQAQTATQGFLTWRVEFDFGGTILVIDDFGGGFVVFDTGVAFPQNVYFELKVEFIPSTGDYTYYIDDVPFYTSVGGLFGGTIVEAVIIGSDTFQNPGEVGSFDNLHIAELVIGGGACCDQSIPLCTDVADVNDCSGTNVVFTEGVTCASVTCDVATGACCTAGRICTDSMTIVDCQSQGGLYIGDGTSCANQMCPVECPAGHAGQVSDGGANNTANLLALLSDSNPVIGATYRVADNFVPTASGNVTSVRWWGEYLEIVAGLPDCVPPEGDSADDFEITYYNSDSDGTNEFPGTVLAGPFSVVPVKTDTGLVTVNGGPFFEYDATHAPVAVDAGHCYWIEVLNNTTGICGWYWLVADGDSGDELAAQNALPPYVAGDLVGNEFDLGWCLDIAVANDGCTTALAVPGACCMSNGPDACVDSDQEICGAVNGTFLGGNTTCATSSCLGACCTGGGFGVCQNEAQIDCENVLFGIFDGVGSDCNVLDPCLEQACCVGGFCSDVAPPFCTGVSFPGQFCGDLVPPNCANGDVFQAPTVPCNTSYPTSNEGFPVPGDVGFPFNPDFSCSAGQPDGAGEFWITFVATDVSAFISTQNSVVADTILEVHTGPDAGNLTPVPASCVDDVDTDLQASVCIATTIGESYWVLVASFNNAPPELGPITVDITCPCPAVCDSCPGDMNDDTILDGGDIQQFSRCLTGAEVNPFFCFCGDMDADGDVDDADIAPFVTAILQGGGCADFPIQECPVGSDGQTPDLENGLASNANALSGRVADNFEALAGGTITQVKWWGVYLGAGCPDAPDSFDVTIHNDDNNGTPGSIHTTLIGQTPVAVVTDRNLLGIAGEYMYTLPGLNINLGPGCYWLAISNASTASCDWFWSTSNDGDAIGAFDPDGTGYLRVEGTDPAADDNDTAWCFDIVLGENTSCLIPMGSCCVDGACQGVTTQAFCNTSNGSWFSGEDCFDTFICPAIVNGACCLDVGGCTDVLNGTAECDALSGDYQGDGTTCVTANCCSVDLDIDSDNDEGVGSVARSVLEDSIEGNAPGKYICLNDDDDDGNDVIDAFEEPINANPPEDDPVPLVMELDPNAPPGQWRIQHTAHVQVYNESRAGPITPNTWFPTPLMPNPTKPQYYWVEGVQLSTNLGDASITLEYDCDGDGTPDDIDTVVASVIAIDVDVDSDNTNNMPDFGPDRDDTEDQIEDREDTSGRLVCVNNDDDDNDGIPDLGDGYDLNDAGNGNDDDANTDENDFVRIVLEVPAPVDLTKARIRVMYDASDPAAATIVQDDPDDPATIEPAPGRLRIWRKNGNVARMDEAINAMPPGDYVSPSTYDPSDFGLTNTMRSVHLWLEGIRTSAGNGTTRILFELDPDGDQGPAGFQCLDAVRCTIIDIEYIETAASEVPDDAIWMLDARPYVEMNTIPGPGNSETVMVTVAGTVKDYVAPLENVLINGNVVNVTQVASGTDDLGPYVGSFTFNLNLTGNTTLIEVQATNAIKNIGRDSLRIEVTRDTDFNITSRTVVEEASEPPAQSDEESFLDRRRFKIELTNPSITLPTVNVEVNTGAETKMVQLDLVGPSGKYRSKDLYLTWKSLEIPAGAPANVAKSRIKAELGKLAKVTYMQGQFKVVDDAVTQGVRIVKKADFALADFAESAIGSDVTAGTEEASYHVRVGLPGCKYDDMLTLKAKGLDRLAQELMQPNPEASFPELEPMLTLGRQSEDASDENYNLYQTEDTSILMAVRSPLPVNGAGVPQENASLKEVYVEYDGAIRISSDTIMELLLVEPIAGMELVATTSAAANVMKATGLIPVNNPAPPIISVADSAPRPMIQSFAASYDAATGPRTIRVTAQVRDLTANMINGNTLAAVGLMVRLNGTPVPAGAVTINRPNSDPPRPFLAEINATIDLEMVPDMADVTAYTARRNLTAEGTEITISQQAVILEVENVLGNKSWDSAFVRLVDADGDANPPFTVSTLENGANFNAPTRFDIQPRQFYVHYHNPITTGASQNSRIETHASGGALIEEKAIQLERKIWGNQFRYGPFLPGSRNRWNSAAPQVPATTPVVVTSEFDHDGAGAVTASRYAEEFEIEAVAPSISEKAPCVPIDVWLSDMAAGGNMRDALLPQGTDSAPRTIHYTCDAPTLTPARGTPAAVRTTLLTEFRLQDVTVFTGHCSNAPRAGTPGLANEDFSFTAGGNEMGPTAQAAFDSAGRLAGTFFSKDNGGRAILRLKMAIPGNPDAEILTEVIADDDGDFLPRGWERLFRNSPGTTSPDNPIRDGLSDDEDRTLNGAAVGHNEAGDGYTALEEYRGFSVTTAAGTTIMRMNDIPFAYGLAPGAGPVTGPRVKDVLVFHQSTVSDTAGNLSVTNAPSFNVAFHKILEADFPAAMPAVAIAHDHQLNFNGDNDGLAVVQNAIHMRDAMLGPGTLGNSGGFHLEGNDVRIDPVNAGGHHGFGANQINGNTIFHELGHKVSLRHCHNDTSDGVHVFVELADPLNNTDVVNPAGAAPDGIDDGAIRVQIATYLPNTEPPGTTIVRGDTNEEQYLSGAHTQFQFNIVIAMDSFGNTTDVRLLRASVPLIPAVQPFLGRVLRPSLMDWTDYLIGPMGPTQQQNLAERQIFVPGPNPGATPLHEREIRVRTTP